MHALLLLSINQHTKSEVLNCCFITPIPKIRLSQNLKTLDIHCLHAKAELSLTECVIHFLDADHNTLHLY